MHVSRARASTRLGQVRGMARRGLQRANKLGLDVASYVTFQVGLELASILYGAVASANGENRAQHKLA